MGLEFLGNPYENEYNDESDLDNETDEEWVVPVDANLLANRQLINPINYWSVSEGESDFSEDDEDFNPDDSIWGEEDDDADDDDDNIGDDDTDHDDDDENDEVDIFQSPDNASYPEYDEIEDVFSQHGPGAYAVDEDDFYDDDDDLDLDYVTYPIENQKPPEQPEKTTSKNTNANNLNTNNSESTTNSTASQELHDD